MPFPPSQTQAVQDAIRRARRREGLVAAAAASAAASEDPRTDRIIRPPDPPTYAPEDGGCVDCGHTISVHTRGRDTIEHCHAIKCDCVWWHPLRTWRTYLRRAAVLAGCVLVALALIAALVAGIYLVGAVQGALT